MRLNVYLPDGLADRVDRYRDLINLSRVCSAAIRDAIDALETFRSAEDLFQKVALARTPLEHRLEQRFGLKRVIAANPWPADLGDPRETVARATAQLVSAALAAEVLLAIGGGLQMWAAVRKLEKESNL
jgi:DNA-binding transcriptional regulator LsrR (DeoR family)